jgi:hypothetical protein
MSLFICNDCSTTIQSKWLPSTAGCEKSAVHHWKLIGKAGDTPFICTKCQKRLKAASTPLPSNCEIEGDHHWVRPIHTLF